MKDITEYYPFLEHAVLYPTMDKIYTHTNSKGPLLPDQEESKDEKDIYKNFTNKDYTLEAIMIYGSSHGTYFSSRKPHETNNYEVFIYNKKDDKTIEVTKIDATMSYKKTLLGKINYNKQPNIKITSIKTSNVNKDENEELYNKITNNIAKVDSAKEQYKKRADYLLEHSGEEYERKMKSDYYNNPWR